MGPPIVPADLVIEDVSEGGVTPAPSQRVSRPSEAAARKVSARPSNAVTAARPSNAHAAGTLQRVMSWEDKQKDASNELKAATRSRDRARLATAIMHAREVGVKGKGPLRALAAAEQALAEVEALAAMTLEADALQRRIRESTSLEASSHVLDPGSTFMQRWDLGIIGALLFTAVFTPFEVRAAIPTAAAAAVAAAAACGSPLRSRAMPPPPPPPPPPPRRAPPCLALTRPIRTYSFPFMVARGGRLPLARAERRLLTRSSCATAS